MEIFAISMPQQGIFQLTLPRASGPGSGILDRKASNLLSNGGPASFIITCGRKVLFAAFMALVKNYISYKIGELVIKKQKKVRGTLGNKLLVV